MLLSAGAAGNFLSRLADLSSNAFKSVVDIDLLGSFNVAKLCLPHLVEAAKRSQPSTSTDSPSIGGRAIFISATMHYTGYPLQTHVVAAKAGVDALSANIAIEYGPHGVTSNVITPGPIKGTEGMSRLSKGVRPGRQEGWKIPLGHYGTVKDIADATVYLFSDAANYVNGEVLVVDGGSWRTANTGAEGGLEYPDSVLNGDNSLPRAPSTKHKGAHL